MPFIETRNLSKTFQVLEKKSGLLASVSGLFSRKYKSISAVEDVSFSVEEGEIVGFLGPNGAGKTTTLKMLSGLLYPSAGIARVMGYVPWERSVEFRKSFSLVMGQKNQLWWDLPAADSFELHKEIYALDEQEFRKTIHELTNLFDVERLMFKPVRELSLGERMKFELIASLLHKPRLLLLDEPTIGLDVVAQSAIHRCLAEYNRSRKTTILLTSHYMRDVESLCSRILVISGGKLIYGGDIKGLKERFNTNKILKIQFLNQVPETMKLDLPGALIKDGVLVCNVRKEDVPRVMGMVAQCEDVVDIVIEEPPLEEVIEKLFQEHKSEK
ncbi:MAG: putative transporter ATP-binding protein YbhF [Planctomycetota bacterium]|jgi:ABC-2 type transport system ATP-binding protein